jgi:hypothetical protein
MARRCIVAADRGGIAMTAATTAQVLWYVTRSSGLVSLVLLTASVVLGILTTVRIGTNRWPRFAFQDLHRRVSFLAVVMVGLHVVTTVSDSYAPIGWLAVVVPFNSPYRRLWLSLGTISVDLLLAVTISSMLRRWISHRAWRGLHWLAYLSWPLAVVHSLGTGTDPRMDWVLTLVVGCVAAVVVAGAWRLAVGWPSQSRVRIGVGALSVVSVVAGAVWTAVGPLRPGWAARAGTPAALLAGRSSVGGPGSSASSSSSSSASSSSPSTPSSPAAGSSGSLPTPPYTASLTGTVSQQAASGGLEQVDIRLQTSTNFQAVLDVLLVGTPDRTGGLSVQQSQATFGPPATPSQYEGRVVGLDGTQMALSLADRSGTMLSLQVNLSIVGNVATGQLSSSTPSGAGGR